MVLCHVATEDLFLVYRCLKNLDVPQPAFTYTVHAGTTSSGATMSFWKKIGNKGKRSGPEFFGVADLDDDATRAPPTVATEKVYSRSWAARYVPFCCGFFNLVLGVLPGLFSVFVFSISIESELIQYFRYIDLEVNAKFIKRLREAQSVLEGRGKGRLLFDIVDAVLSEIPLNHISLDMAHMPFRAWNTQYLDQLWYVHASCCD